MLRAIIIFGRATAQKSSQPYIVSSTDARTVAADLVAFLKILFYATYTSKLLQTTNLSIVDLRLRRLQMLFLSG